MVVWVGGRSRLATGYSPVGQWPPLIFLFLFLFEVDIGPEAGRAFVDIGPAIEYTRRIRSVTR